MHTDKQETPVHGADGHRGRPSFAHSEQERIFSFTIVICGGLVVKQQLRLVGTVRSVLSHNPHITSSSHNDVITPFNYSSVHEMIVITIVRMLVTAARHATQPWRTALEYWLGAVGRALTATSIEYGRADNVVAMTNFIRLS